MTDRPIRWYTLLYWRFLQFIIRKLDKESA